MKLLFLGTGAADWPTQIIESCEFSRRFSSLLIDDTLLIDPGPMVIDAIKEFCVDTSKIKYIINTHKHSDHYDSSTVEYLTSLGAKFIDIKAGEDVSLGKYTIKAFKANHTIETVHFLITDGNKKLFYALDGGWLTYEEIIGIWENKVIDYMVLDATVGFVDGDYRIFEHNNLNMVIEIKKSLCERDVKHFSISHMAYTLHGTHDELCRMMSEHGIEVAYDGKIVEI
jgi:phosphoribosyl 1,2-cyclic phosphate phosphodiesterase